MDASMENALAHFRNAQKQLCAGERLAARTEFLLASLELFQLAAAATDPSEKRRLLERAQRLNGIAERITPSEKVDSPTASKSRSPGAACGSPGR